MAVDEETDTGEGEQQQQEGEDAGVSCSLDMFREHQEVRQMVDAIGQVVDTEFTAEKAFEDLKKILDNYQDVSAGLGRTWRPLTLTELHPCVRTANSADTDQYILPIVLSDTVLS